MGPPAFTLLHTITSFWGLCNHTMNMATCRLCPALPHPTLPRRASPPCFCSHGLVMSAMSSKAVTHYSYTLRQSSCSHVSVSRCLIFSRPNTRRRVPFQKDAQPTQPNPTPSLPTRPTKSKIKRATNHKQKHQRKTVAYAAHYIMTPSRRVRARVKHAGMERDVTKIRKKEENVTDRRHSLCPGRLHKVWNPRGKHPRRAEGAPGWWVSCAPANMSFAFARPASLPPC
jgi:hypothetical protein